MNASKIGLAVAVSLFLAACVGHNASEEASAGRQGIAPASFNADDTVNFPTGFRGWEHVGSRVAPIEVHIFDNKVTETPEIMNTYVEPSAYAAFQATGEWPEGTQIAKEFAALRTGEGCDSTTLLCNDAALGTGIFQTHYMGVGLMIKDAKRFPDAPGHWGYFEFGHQREPYRATAPLRPYEQCAACHVAIASDTDYVISRAHIGMQRKENR